MFDRIQHIHYPNVQKVLPAVYGDELSYYELLAKFEDKINNLITLANELGVDVAWAVDAMKNIADLPEIDAKVKALQETADTIQATLEALPSYAEFTDLSQMVDSNTSGKVPFPIAPNAKYGTDGQVLRTNGDGTTQWQNPIIPSDAQAQTYISAWLDAHPEAVTTVADGSVTFAKLANDTVDDLTSILNTCTNQYTLDSWEIGGFNPTKGVKTSLTYAIRTKLRFPPAIYICHVDEGYRLATLTRFPDGTFAMYTWYTAGTYFISSQYPIDFIIRRSSGAAEMSLDEASYVQIRYFVQHSIVKHDSLVSDALEAIAQPLEYDVYTVVNRAIRMDGNIVAATTGLTGFEQTMWISVSQYDYIMCPVFHTTLNTQQLSLAFYSGKSDSTFVEGVAFVPDTEDKWVVTIVKVPVGANWMVSSLDLSGDTVVSFKGIPKKPLQGMKLSVLSDSMSAMAGYIPEGNNPYYTGNNADVSNVNEMWWKRLCNATGMEPLVIDAWSGSTIAYNARDNQDNFTPMCSDERTSRLGVDGTNPDIIIISGGTNDFNRSTEDRTPLGDIDDSVTSIDREAVLNGTSTFAESYASTIQRLQANYPHAIIVCASLYYCNYTRPFKHNSVGVTARSYNEVIKKVCEYMSVPYMQIYDLGFSINNYKYYAGDSVTSPVHANAAGQAVIANRYIEVLPTLVKQILDVKRNKGL